MLKAIIIDDEPYCCEILAAMLESDCPEIEITGICNNAKDALTTIRQYSPDLVFLDVEMQIGRASCRERVYSSV